MCLMNIIMTVSENTRVRLCSKNKKVSEKEKKKNHESRKINNTACSSD